MARKSLRFHDINIIDFEKVFWGVQLFVNFFWCGERRRVVAEFNPKKKIVKVNLFKPDKNGNLKYEAHGSVQRKDCERFLVFIGKKYIEDFEPGKRQRIIIDYDPQNKKAGIGLQVK